MYNVCYRFRYFDSFWRVRIDGIKVVLLDAEGHALKSPGQVIGSEVKVSIKLPSVFNDTDVQGVSHAFLGRGFQCRADYTTLGFEEVKYISECSVDDEFSDLTFQPSLDGIFSIRIENNLNQYEEDDIDMSLVDKMLIQISGNYVPFRIADARGRFHHQSPKNYVHINFI